MIEVLANIDVDDLEKAIEFYGRALGFRTGRRFGTKAAEMLGASSPIYLLAKPVGSPAFANASVQRDYRRHWTPIHLDFVVADLEGAVRCAEAAGANLEGELQVHEWGRIANMADPFGHGFCLLEFTGRGYDEIAGSD